MLFKACRIEVPIDHGTAEIIATLRARLTVGILVERLHGKKVERVGRVPLGTHAKGDIRLRWNLRVGGTRLERGHYRVTLRALNARRDVLGLSNPVTVSVP